MRADLGYAWRQLRRAPAFTAAAALTLGIGIGGAAIMFGVVDGLFLRPPGGLHEPSELVRLFVVRDEGTIQTAGGGGGSYPDYRAIRDHAQGFTGIAGFLQPRELDFGLGPDARRARGQLVTGEFFRILGVQPAVGRLLTPDDDARGAVPVAVLGYALWRREFGGAPSVVGRTLTLNGSSVTVTGVAAPDFTGIGADRVDLWLPTATSAELGFGDFLDERFWIVLNYVGRLEPGIDPGTGALRAAAALRADAVEGLDPDPDVIATPINEARGPFRTQTAEVAVWLALATGILLLISCVNVANLLLARGTRRRHEIAIRRALGAGRSRIVRLFLAESALLALLGGAAGVLLAFWGEALVRGFPLPASAARFDERVLVFALGMSLLAGLTFGLAPALHATRTDPNAGLQDTGPGSGPARRRLRQALVAAQLALSLILLVGAGLLARSLTQVHRVDPGVDMDRLLTVSVRIEQVGYSGPAREDFYASAMERLRAVPGIERASLARVEPLARFGYAAPFRLPDGERIDTGGEGPYAEWVGPGYFRTVGTPILTGRGITEADASDAQPVVVVNRTLARRIAPEGNVVGRCVLVGGQVEAGGCTRIVGVAADVRHRYLQERIVPKYYLPRAQHAPNSAVILLRTATAPERLIQPVRVAIHELDRQLPYIEVHPLSEVVRDQVLPYRIGASLFSIFALLATGLAAVGLYAVVAFLVAERTHEFGVRLSLGARPSDLAGQVIRQAARPLAVGLLIGGAGALAGTRLFEALLFGVSPQDPLTFVMTAAFLAVVALLASWLPARRAAAIDPMITLRSE